MRSRKAVVLLATLSACGGGRGGSAVTAAEVGAYAGDVVDAHAAALVRCQDAAPAFAQAMAAGMIMTRADLVARTEQVYARGRLRFDPALGAQCLAELDAAQSCWDVAVARNDPAHACRRAITGTVPLGGACTASSECAGGRCDAGATCPAVCVARGVAGEACSLTSDCAAGHACYYPAPFPATTAGQCARNDLAEGMACGSLSTGYCRADLACRVPSGGSQPICTATRPVGASCADEPSSCALDGFCEGTSCVARHHAGEACSSPGQCQVGSYCSAGTCVAFGGVGAPCGALSGAFVPCVGAWCPISSTTEWAACVPYRAYGEGCATTDRCRTVLSCDATTSTCVEPCL